MPPLAYLVAKCCSAAVFGLIIVSLLTLLGITFGHVSITLTEYARMMALTLVGTIPFACLGMVIALLVPSNAAPGVINMIYLPMSFCGGLWLPVMILPHVLQKFALLLPTYHLSQLVLACFGYASAGSAMSHWLGLFGFTLVMLGIAADRLSPSRAKLLTRRRTLFRKRHDDQRTHLEEAPKQVGMDVVRLHRLPLHRSHPRAFPLSLARHPRCLLRLRRHHVGLHPCRGSKAIQPASG